MPWTTNIRIPGQKSKASPALAQFRGELHIAHPGDSSNDIWHSVFNGTDWSPNERIPDQKSKSPSALAEFLDRLHITHLGDSSNRIWHSSFDGARWTTNEPIEGELSQAAPAMAVFQGQLHLVHIGDSSHRLFHLEFDGLRWRRRGANEGLENQRSKGAVALAEFSGELHMVHQGDTSNRLWHTRFNGTRWSENEVIEGQLSKSPPALAAFNGLLHMVHLGDSSNRIWHSTFDGTTWAANVPIPYQLSKAVPALAAFGDRLHMVHLGDSSNDIWHSTSDGVLVRRPARRVILVDLDGIRWDSFYRHLKRVRDAGASTDVTYSFALPAGASDDTVLGDGGIQLRSALAELCFGPGNGMVDVRLALAAYPSFTFPSHATMYTGTPPGQHGITGHTFVVRDAPPEWDRHSWDSLPRGPALQGYCTDAETEAEAAADWFWGGFDTVGENSCRNRNRGLVSDLRVPNLFERAHAEGLRSCSIHSFYHGALRPWDAEGKDQWWRYSPPELRSVKDICSDEDLDQLETVDHGALTKAELLLDFMPSTIQVLGPMNMPLSVPASTHPLTGERRPGWGIRGEPHPDGVPDLVAIYLASVDNASHIDGIRNQETYLAWFDHRLARFVRALRQKDPEAFDNTTFAFVTDHGHATVAAVPDTEGLPASNTLSVREELVRILLGDPDGQEFLDLAQLLSQAHGVSYSGLVADALEDDFGAWAEAMNLYVYVRDPDLFPPVDVARRLLSIPMRTEPYGALVLVNGDYQFLARGEPRPVPVNSPACRAIVVPHLDVTPASAAELDATTLSPADADAEQQLRDRLVTGEGFDLLRVAERVAGLRPVLHNNSPDVILVAPARQSFSGGASTHGSFAYPTSRIPMVFCGPGIPPGQGSIEQAGMVDVAPTVLSLLGLGTTGMEGRPLLDQAGRIIPRRTPGPVPPRPPAGPRPTGPRRPPVRPSRRLPPVTAVLQPSSTRPATGREIDNGSELQIFVALSVQTPCARREVGLGEPSYVESRCATVVVAGRADAWVEAGGDRQPVRNGAEVPLHAGCRTRIGSKSSRGAIEIPRACVVQPVSIRLPRVPDWLRLAERELARTARVVIDGKSFVGGSILVPAAEFERVVAGVYAQLAAPDTPVGPPEGFERPAVPVEQADRLAECGCASPGSAEPGPDRPPPPVATDMAKVRRSLRMLESVFHKATVARLEGLPGHRCGGDHPTVAPGDRTRPEAAPRPEVPRPRAGVWPSDGAPTSHGRTTAVRPG
ncbi:MAG TPA: alkaline phosphatase family protein [Gemmataceae bacterium]|nr:alkaline phosphatase family protein [Gemmataceae bacterium]